jgi:hypothetical protein
MMIPEGAQCTSYGKRNLTSICWGVGLLNKDVMQAITVLKKSGQCPTADAHAVTFKPNEKLKQSLS